MHCFEVNGLGKAPYTYLHCVDMGKVAASCQHCNTGIRYKFYLRSADGKEFFVGSDCIIRSGDLGLSNIASRERKRIAKEQRDAKNAAKWAEIRARRELSKVDRLNQWLENNSDFVPVIDWAKVTPGVPQNMHESLLEYGSLTGRQMDYLTKLHTEAQNPTPKSPCPEGKVTIEGTIVSTKWVDNAYGSQLKMTVASNGFKVFGSVPKSLNSVEKGDTIRFDATVQRSPSDESFGFFSRPTQATFV